MPKLAEKWIEQGRIKGQKQGMILEAQEMVLEALIGLSPF